MNVTIFMLTERHALKGFSDIARYGDTDLLYKPSSIDLEFNCMIAYLRWRFDYAINFAVHSKNLSWISFGRKEHYILNPKVRLRFSVDLASKNIYLKKLNVHRNLLVTESLHASRPGKKAYVPDNGETKYAMDFHQKPGKKFLRRLLKSVLGSIVKKFLSALAETTL